MSANGSASLSEEIARRRTFAIISHPDAGKTTLTEKLLLYGGAVHQAGAVASKAGQAHATSDWMKLEQERGISISASALQFDHDGYRLNLLDTPGHQDFSEDTYRTLTAADSAVMLLDAARGVQAQTEKLFSVCRLRGIPVFTFMNKLDRPALDPFALLEEVERVLGIVAVPLTWPIGDGPDFKGVYEFATRQVHLFERSHKNAQPAPVKMQGLDDPHLAVLLGADAYERLKDEAGIVEGLIPAFDPQAFANGLMTPVFFGSVLTSFGVEVFLKHFLELAPAPGPLHTHQGEISPRSETFSAFIFKLQANMNRHHRDRTAYARVTSGRFTRGMHTIHTRTGREIKLARAHTLFAQEREIIEEAFPGDIIGLINPGLFRIGDVISDDPAVSIQNFPRFAPETFATVRPAQAEKHKAFHKGLSQLAEEGVVQLFFPVQGARDPMLGAVGQLQFDVFRERMLDEYGVIVEPQPQPYTLLRWAASVPAATESYVGQVTDADGNLVLLFKSKWELSYFERNNPGLKLFDLPEIEQQPVI